MLLSKLFMNIYICSNISNEVTRIQNSKIKIILLANLNDNITRKLLHLEKSYYTSMNRTNFYLSYDPIGIKSKCFFLLTLELLAILYQKEKAMHLIHFY